MPIIGIGLGDNPFSGGSDSGSDSSDPDPAGDGVDGSPYPGLQPDLGLGDNPFADGDGSGEPQGPANQDERPRIDGDTDIDEDDLEDPVDPDEQNVGQYLPLPIPRQDSGPSTALVAAIAAVVVAVAAVAGGS